MNKKRTISSEISIAAPKTSPLIPPIVFRDFPEPAGQFPENEQPEDHQDDFEQPDQRAPFLMKIETAVHDDRIVSQRQNRDSGERQQRQDRAVSDRFGMQLFFQLCRHAVRVDDRFVPDDLQRGPARVNRREEEDRGEEDRDQLRFHQEKEDRSGQRVRPVMNVFHDFQAAFRRSGVEEAVENVHEPV